MVLLIVAISLMFGYLLYETKGLTIRLLVGIETPIIPKYARYKVYSSAKGNSKSYTGITGNNYPEDYSPNGEPEYNIFLSPGIDNILCGWKWLDKHCADLVDYQPKVYMAIGNIRYNMTIRQPSIIKDVMKVNKLSKKQVKALA